MNFIFNIKQSTSELSRLCIVAVLITFFIACQKDQAIHAPIISQDDSADNDTQIKALASALNLKAYTEEEKVTRRLQDLAKTHQAKLQGLEHRLKTKSSTLRKLKKMHHDAPELPLEKLKLSDALRYTIEVSDQPEGHYVKTVHTILKDLETQGYKILKVKNYWPKGDNYSGVNTVLANAEGFEWELQFHTPGSYQESKQSHGKYEKLRAIGTPLEERQKLFKSMAQPWETVVIPKGVLEPENLHKIEVIKKWEAPKE